MSAQRVILQTSEGLQVSVELIESDAGTHIELGGLNCELDGDEPGRYRLVVPWPGYTAQCDYSCRRGCDH